MTKSFQIYICKSSSQSDLYQIKNYAMRNNIRVDYLSYASGDTPQQLADWFNSTFHEQLILKNYTVVVPFNTLLMVSTDSNGIKDVSIGKNEILDKLRYTM